MYWIGMRGWRQIQHGSNAPHPPPACVWQAHAHAHARTHTHAHTHIRTATHHARPTAASESPPPSPKPSTSQRGVALVGHALLPEDLPYDSLAGTSGDVADDMIREATDKHVWGGQAKTWFWDEDRGGRGAGGILQELRIPRGGTSDKGESMAVSDFGQSARGWRRQPGLASVSLIASDSRQRGRIEERQIGRPNQVAWSCGEHRTQCRHTMNCG